MRKKNERVYKDKQKEAGVRRGGGRREVFRSKQTCSIRAVEGGVGGSSLSSTDFSVVWNLRELVVFWFELSKDDVIIFGVRIIRINRREQHFVAFRREKIRVMFKTRVVAFLVFCQDVSCDILSRDDLSSVGDSSRELGSFVLL